MNQRGESIRVVHPLFHGEGGGSTPTSPLQLTVGEITPDKAIQLNAAWHSRLPAVDRDNIQRVRHLVCFGAECGGVFYAAAIWTDPIARKLNGRDWLELRRLAIASDAPKNTASRMLRVMTLFIKRKWPHIVRLISYQDKAVHTGTIYKAAGWLVGSEHKVATGWDTRKRNPMQSTADKARWELPIREQFAQGNES